MLTDTALRNLKPKSKTYKASDRDGMYVTVSPTGTVTFRYDYRLNGRRETLTSGRYGPSGISRALARQKLIDAKTAVAQGKVPRTGEAAREATPDRRQDLWRGDREVVGGRADGRLAFLLLPIVKNGGLPPQNQRIVAYYSNPL